jgi:hypothetical protein
MQLLSFQLATFAVAALYYVWRAHYQVRLRRHRLLRERVTYMLWVMAQGICSSDSRPRQMTIS